jgi:hypothetical protein
MNNAGDPDEADGLRRLVATMRELGVTSYERAGLRVMLGPDPPPASAPITDAQRREIARKAAEGQAALLYASSEGFPVDDEGAPV